MTKPPDDNDRAVDGTLPKDPSADTAKVKPAVLHVVKPGERRSIPEPSDPDAEDALLGALLWSGKYQPQMLRVKMVGDILENGIAFYGRGRTEIFDAITACAKDGAEHDPVAVFAQLVRTGNDRRAGGREMLDRLVDNASTVSETQARVYAQSIRETWARRLIISDARRLAEEARNPKASIDALVQQGRDAVAAASLRTASTAMSISLRQSAESLFQLLTKGNNTAIPTGLRQLDEALNGGLRPGEVSLLAARPSVGKSTLAAQIAEHMTTVDPTCCALYVTLEMKHEMFTARLLSARSGVPMNNMRRMVLTPTQWSQVTAAVAELATKGVYFADSATQTLASIYATASQLSRILAREGKRLGLLVIDHVGLVKPSAEALKKSNREQQVAETSRGQRFIATEIGCHVMGIAHISREGEKDSGNRMPQPRHLRESGALENDADTVMILHRERDPDTGIMRTDKPAALAIAKARLDETAIMLLGYEPQHARFSSWTNENEKFSDFYGS